MTAEFYLIAESFAENSALSKEEIENKTKSLATDFTYIKQYGATNKLLVNPNMYNVKFIENITISDLLFNTDIANKHLDRDVRNALKKIIIEQETTDITTKDVKEVLLLEHNESLCHGLIGFNLVNGINPDFQVVYHIKGWFDFRRYYLGLYPKNAGFFIEECKKYFPKLFFHERNKTSINSILSTCPKKIIYHLSALNDKFKESFAQGNRTEVLEHFSTNTSLDEIASLEGDARRKPNFTFLFKNVDNVDESVCCEPHLKLCYSDLSTAYSTDRRIYFHEGKSNIQGGKILIGHIGNHL